MLHALLRPLPALLLLFGCAPPIPAGTIPVQRALQPSRMLTVQAPAAQQVHLQALIDAGSQRDPMGGEGLAYLVAHGLVEGGAGERDGEAVRRALEQLEARVEVELSQDTAHLAMRCPPAVQRECLALFTDLLVRPRFEEEALQSLRERASHALDELSTGPTAILPLTRALLLEGLPSAHPIQGRQGVIPLLDSARAARFHRDHYVRESVVWGILGPWEEEVLASLDEARAQLPGAMVPDPNRFGPPSLTETTLTVLPTGPADQAWLAVGAPLPLPEDHPDWPALQLWAAQLDPLQDQLWQALGGPISDEAAPALRLCVGTCDPLRPTSKRVPPILYMELGPIPIERSALAMRAMLTALGDAQRQAPSPAALQQARDRLLAHTQQERRDPSQRLASALRATLHPSSDPLHALAPALQELPPEALPQALSAHLDLDRLVWVARTGAPDALLELVEGFAPSRVHPRPPEGAEAPVSIDQSRLIDPEGIFR